MTLSDASTPKSRIYTVSEINAEIKHLMEDKFPFVWLMGEISNLRVPSSGHMYFSLKDAHSQISAVMFKGQRRGLKFRLEDGLAVTGLGRISVYEPRGTYQIILEYVEPKGVGALQLAFEQLKKRLTDEGFFDDHHKKPLPYLPRRIAVVTSPTGAVVHDILNILDRRSANIPVEIIPVNVQGKNAVNDLINGIALANTRKVDVVILARGGGSLEDLQAYNSERLAMTIFESEVPIISAVGHETDYTIADFVADLRAPTPSAAAELVVPLKSDLIKKTIELKHFIIHYINHYIDVLRSDLNRLTTQLVDPQKRVQDWRLRLDDHTSQLLRYLSLQIQQSRLQLDYVHQKLNYNNPMGYITKYNEKINYFKTQMRQSISLLLKQKQALIQGISSMLGSLDPTAVLARGYSITRTISEASVVTSSDQVKKSQPLEILLANGTLSVEVKGKKP